MLCSLALPIQAAVSLSFTAYTRGLCATSALSSPGALRLAGAVRRALHPAAGIMAASPADLLADCAVLLNFLQLGLGLALPALLQAAAEVRCWRVHQAQRAAARLPPEPGRRQARLYAVLGELLFPLGRPVLLLGALGLYSITWTLAALLAAAW